MPGDNLTTMRPRKPCPICSDPAERAYYPFCSVRCADIDLNRWLTGSYAIPVVENDADPVEPAGFEDDPN